MKEKLKVGRKRIATDQQIENMADAFKTVTRRTKEYRLMRKSFAQLMGCTEKAIEIMVDRFWKQAAKDAA